jgi:hypothetical protein
MYKEPKNLGRPRQEQDTYLGMVEGKDPPSACPPRGPAELDPYSEPPLSNRLISDRANSKRGSQDTGGSIEIYPSMLVRKRDSSDYEQDYYDMLSRFGKKSRHSGSRRGQIDHFSKDSRFRMLKKLGSIGREDPPHMVTLTYRSGSVTFEQAKKDLHKWSKRMNRLFGIRHETTEPWVNKEGFHKLRKRYKYEGTWSGTWRFEVTTGRGTRAKGATPHFHVLVWCDEWHSMNMDDLDQRLSEIWCEVTGDGGEDRMKYGCKIDYSGGDQTKIKNYMLGHHGKKTDQEATGGGRHWGMFNSDLLRIGEPTAVHKLTPKQRHMYDRITCKLIATRRKFKDKRDLSALKEIHTVLAPHDTHKLLRFLELS